MVLVLVVVLVEEEMETVGSHTWALGLGVYPHLAQGLPSAVSGTCLWVRGGLTRQTTRRPSRVPLGCREAASWNNLRAVNKFLWAVGASERAPVCQGPVSVQPQNAHQTEPSSPW